MVIVERDRVGHAEIETALRTFAGYFSKANSGVWTPITTSPSARLTHSPMPIERFIAAKTRAPPNEGAAAFG